MACSVPDLFYLLLDVSLSLMRSNVAFMHCFGLALLITYSFMHCFGLVLLFALLHGLLCSRLVLLVALDLLYS